MGRVGYPNLGSGRNVWIFRGETFGSRGPLPHGAQIGPSGPNGPIWPIDAAGGVRTLRWFPRRESTQFGPYSGSGSQPPLNFRCAVTVISPIRTTKAPGPNPRQGRISPHRILNQSKIDGWKSLRISLALSRVWAGHFRCGSVKLPLRRSGNLSKNKNDLNSTPIIERRGICVYPRRASSVIKGRPKCNF